MRNLNSVHLNSVQPSAISSLLIYPAGLLEKFKTYYRSLFGLTRPLELPELSSSYALLDASQYLIQTGA